MIRIFKLVLLLVVSQVAFGQAPSNYTNINGRYRWIAGMFDSTFHIPKGTSPSLRTGGSTNAGGLFYNTSDSSVYTYTGTQWIKARGSINPSDTTNKYVTQVYKKNGSDSVFYVKGGNHLFAFIDSVGSPGGGGGGKIYYFNGGVSMGTIGGLQMYELGDTANTGAAANFTRSTTGNIANFITDPGKPGLVQIPAGVWSVDAWLSETGGGANHAEIWIEVEKWDGSTITTIATSPIEQITEGSTPNLYSWSVSIPTTSLTVTDRIIIQFYISNTNGKTVTLYTQNGYVGEVHTTFTTGIGAINGLTAPAQYLVTGTSGTDFNINSVTATHTFNLPTASATNRGALSSTDWTTFNSKIGGSGTTNYVSKFTGSGTIGNSLVFDNGTSVGIGTTTPTGSGLEVFSDAVGGRLRLSRDAGTAKGSLQFGRNNGGSFQETSRISGAADNASVNNGSMTFQTSDGSGSLQINMTIESDGNVSVANKIGVGTLTQDSALTVEQGTHLQRGVRMSGLPSAVGTKSLRIDANGTLSVADTLTNGISGSGTTNYIPKFTSSSAIGNSLIFDNGTNVGIGTNNPTAGRLQINVGDITTAAHFQIVDATTTLANSFVTNFRNANDGNGRYSLSSWQAQNAVGNDQIGFIGVQSVTGGANYTPNLIFGQKTGASSYTTRMILDASGNLGLGTTNPSNKLTVSNGSDVGYLDFNNQSFILGTSTVSGISLFSSSATGVMTFSTNSILRMTLDASGNLGLGVTPSAWGSAAKAFQIGSYGSFSSFTNELDISSNSYWNAGYKYTNTNPATLYTQYNGQHQWFNAPSGTAGNAISFTQAMTLDASGNLGLGVTPSDALSYGRALDIQGTNGSALYVRSATNSSTVYGLFSYDNNTVRTNIGGIGASNYLRFISGGDERMRITSGGNVGIGTGATSPQSIRTTNLDISNTSGTNGVGLALSPSSTGIATIRFGASNTVGYDLNYNVAGVGSGSLALYDNVANAYRLTILSSGNVGIGTTSPAVLFSIGKIGTANQLGFYDGATAKGFIGISAGTSDIISTDALNDMVIRPSSAGNMLFAIGSTERMRITSGGNVGIGTSSPTTFSGFLTVEQNNASGNSIHLVTGTSVIYQTIASNTNSAVYIGSRSNHPLLFTTNDTERMRITSGGEVYIGNNPADQGAYNLQVNGTGVWGAGAYVNGSDSALKYNIQPLEPSLDIVKQMKPVTFEYQPFYSKDTTTQTGFIAQDLQRLLADKVYKNGIVKEGGAYLGVAYENIIPLLVKSIQELEAKVENLKSQLNNR